MGIKGYKIDRGEENEMPDSEQNIQMDLMIKLCDESMVNHYGKGKHFTFARSAVDRSRSLVSIWNGDPQATFQGLAYSLTSGIRAGLLGFSHWGSDTGGYLRPSDNPLVPSDELWARWMHLSTWSPMYEIMVGTGHTPWYAPYSTRLVAVLRHTADLHTRLIPLFRSLLYESSRVSGIPAMRALFLEFPGDGDPVYASPGPADDEFLLGENILVAPIVSEGGTRKVYFPGGGGSSPTRWLEWYNKTAVVPGGTSRNVSVDWMESPVYVREGAILTLGDVYRGNALWIANWTSSLDIEVYPSYSVPRATARYYTGAKEDGTVGPVVDITAVADRASQTVSVSWNGPLLVDAVTVVVYGKDQVRRVSVASGSTTMNVTVSQFKTLFD